MTQVVSYFKFLLVENNSVSVFFCLRTSHLQNEGEVSGLVKDRWKINL